MSNTEYKLSNEQKTQLAAAWFAKDGYGDVSHRKALALIEAIEAATAAKAVALAVITARSKL